MGDKKAVENAQIRHLIEQLTSDLGSPLVLPPGLCAQLQRRGITCGYIASKPIPPAREHQPQPKEET